MGETEALPDVGRSSQALRCYTGDGVPIDDEDCPFRSWSQLQPSNTGNDISHRRDPCLLASSIGGWLTVSTDPGSNYRTLQWNQFGAGPDWVDYDDMLFSTKPACTVRDIEIVQGEQRQGFLIAGKRTSSNTAVNNRIYVSSGLMAKVELPQQNPPEGSWQQVSGTAYGSGGDPALGYSVGGFGSPVVLLAFMAGSNNRTIYAHTHAVPYGQYGWSLRITGPTLPTGWNSVGAPSIQSTAAAFRIMVHARNGFGADRLFSTYFFHSHDSSGFCGDHYCNSPAAWVQHANLGTIGDAPSITAYPVPASYGTNVYFRRGVDIMQTTDEYGFSLGSFPLYRVQPLLRMSNGIDFASAPAATSGVYWEGSSQHVLVARTTSNQMWWALSNGAWDLGP